MNETEDFVSMKHCLIQWVQKVWAIQFFRFSLVGGACYLINMSFTFGFTRWFGLWYVASVMIGDVASDVPNFFLQKFLTFRRRNRTARQVFWFTLLKLCNTFVIVPGFTYVVVERSGLWYLAAQTGAIAYVGLQNFLVCRFLIFR